jgi:hypothetical protein
MSKFTATVRLDSSRIEYRAYAPEMFTHKLSEETMIDEARCQGVSLDEALGHLFREAYLSGYFDKPVQLVFDLPEE